MAFQEQTEKHAFAQQQGAEAVRKLTGAPPSAVEEAHQRVEARDRLRQTRRRDL